MSLLRLPLELRIRIYETLFLGRQLKWLSDYHWTEYSDSPRLPSILLVSRQIRTECRPVILGTAQFDMSAVFNHQCIPNPVDYSRFFTLRHISYDCDGEDYADNDFAEVVERLLPNLVSLTVYFSATECYSLCRPDCCKTGVCQEDVDMIQHNPLQALGSFLDTYGQVINEVSEKTVDKIVCDLIKAWNRRARSFKLESQIELLIDNGEDTKFRLPKASGNLDLETQQLKVTSLDGPSKTFEVKLDLDFTDLSE